MKLRKDMLDKIGAFVTVISLGLNLLSSYVDDRRMNELIDEKVREQVREQIKALD